MVFAELVIQAHFRVEEVVDARNVKVLGRSGGIIPTLVLAAQPVVDMAPLKVDVAVESLAKIVIGFEVEISVPFLTAIAIELVVGIYGGHMVVVQRRKHVTEVPSRVFVHAAAEGGLQAAVLVGQIEHTAAETVVHHLFTRDVGIAFRQLVCRQIRAQDVLLIVSVTLRVVRRSIHRPMTVELMREEQLVVMLEIVVGLVVVVMASATGVGIHVAARIVAAAEFRRFFL